MALAVGTNSWVTEAEADAYFLERINATNWAALTSTVKEQYLITSYKWVYYDPNFSVPASADFTAVKDGQCEAALFLLNYGEEFDKRSALINSGVLKFQYSRWTENLGEIKKPENVINFFTSAGFYNGGVVMTLLVDPSEIT